MTGSETGQFVADRTIIWLASYPKSGSTWLRALFTAYLCPDDPLNLDALLGGPAVFERSLLDDHAAIDSATLRFEEQIAYQASLHRAFARSGPRLNLVKTHSAFQTDPDGVELFPRDASAGAIVIVRNPCDIVASYAHHEGKSLDQIIARMADANAMQDHWTNRVAKAIPQRISSWSHNVISWLDQRTMPLCLVRYEDLLADPKTEFARILEFCCIDLDQAVLENAVSACRFDRMAQIENEHGFPERPSASRSFFRSGRAGSGNSELNARQIEQLRYCHGRVMERLGY